MSKSNINMFLVNVIFDDTNKKNCTVFFVVEFFSKIFSKFFLVVEIAIISKVIDPERG